MVRPTVLLTALLASTGASAQFVDYIKGALAGAVQAPLVSNTRVAAEPKEITSANWREVTNVTVPAEGETVVAEPKEWFFYFTHGNYTSPRNLTYWDGVFNVSHGYVGYKVGLRMVADLCVYRIRWTR